MNILIVGATSGIGKALYSHYISCDNNVAIMGRRKSILDEIYAANPSKTFSAQTDISNVKPFNDAFNSIIKSLCTIDLAIVCASVGELNETLDISQELTTLSTNVVGWTNAVDTIYHHFETMGKGHLVTITADYSQHLLLPPIARARLSKLITPNRCKPRRKSRP